MEFRKTDYEQIRRTVMIVDYARSLGFTIKRVGSYYTIKEHDSVRIDPRKNIFYRNSNGAHGSVIDFALEFSCDDKASVIKELEEIAYACSGLKLNKADPEIHNRTDKGKEAKCGLLLPEKDSNMRNVYAYLTKTRGINPKLVDWLVKSKMLYQDVNKNCVFVCYKENEPIAACKRGTNTYKRFVSSVEGSDEAYGILLSPEKLSESLVIVEGVIDALSLMSIHADEYMNCHFLALTGTGKDAAVYTHVRTGNYKRVILALDNDAAGQAASDRIEANIESLGAGVDIQKWIPSNKDWNDDLLEVRSQRG